MPRTDIGHLLGLFGYTAVSLEPHGTNEVYNVALSELEDFLLRQSDGTVLYVHGIEPGGARVGVRLEGPDGYLDIKSIRWFTVNGEPTVTASCVANDNKSYIMPVQGVEAWTAMPIQNADMSP